MTFEKLKSRWKRDALEQAERAQTFKRDLLKKATPIFKRYKIQQAYIFGSVAEGRCREKSDIDIYVSPLPAEDYWQFRHELEEAVQLPIDLYTDSDDPVFIKKIISRGEQIYGL
jgi:predicted nucleotidyltransferase